MAQIIYATFLGIFFAGIYLRTKNIWLCMLIHALIDISAGFAGIVIRTGTATAISAPTSILEAFIQCAIILPFGLYGLFLLRKVDWKNSKSLEPSKTAISA
jgi:membrane protease YdiL (CAAX protease family)